MTAESQSLVLDLVEWVAARPRPYAEVMDAWRTSCPRLSIWEDAVDQGLVVREQRDGEGTFVRVTPSGRALLAAHGRRPQEAGATPPVSQAPAPRHG